MYGNAMLKGTAILYKFRRFRNAIAGHFRRDSHRRISRGFVVGERKLIVKEFLPAVNC